MRSGVPSRRSSRAAGQTKQQDPRRPQAAHSKQLLAQGPLPQHPQQFSEQCLAYHSGRGIPLCVQREGRVARHEEVALQSKGASWNNV